MSLSNNEQFDSTSYIEQYTSSNSTHQFHNCVVSYIIIYLYFLNNMIFKKKKFILETFSRSPISDISCAANGNKNINQDLVQHIHKWAIQFNVSYLCVCVCKLNVSLEV